MPMTDREVRRTLRAFVGALVEREANECQRISGDTLSVTTDVLETGRALARALDALPRDDDQNSEKEAGTGASEGIIEQSPSMSASVPPSAPAPASEYANETPVEKALRLIRFEADVVERSRGTMDRASLGATKPALYECAAVLEREIVRLRSEQMLARALQVGVARRRIAADWRDRALKAETERDAARQEYEWLKGEYSRMCDRLQETAQRYHLGLGRRAR